MNMRRDFRSCSGLPHTCLQRDQCCLTPRTLLKAFPEAEAAAIRPPPRGAPRTCCPAHPLMPAGPSATSATEAPPHRPGPCRPFLRSRAQGLAPLSAAKPVFGSSPGRASPHPSCTPSLPGVFGEDSRIPPDALWWLIPSKCHLWRHLHRSDFFN